MCIGIWTLAIQLIACYLNDCVITAYSFCCKFVYFRQVALCSIVYTRSVWPSTRRPRICLSCHVILLTHTSNGHSRSCSPNTNRSAALQLSCLHFLASHFILYLLAYVPYSVRSWTCVFLICLVSVTSVPYFKTFTLISEVGCLLMLCFDPHIWPRSGSNVLWQDKYVFQSALLPCSSFHCHWIADVGTVCCLFDVQWNLSFTFQETK